MLVMGVARRSRRLPLTPGRLLDFWPEYDAVYLQWPVDVLQLDLADAHQSLRDFIVHLIEHLTCDRDPTWIGQGLNTRGDVHAVAHNVAAAVNDIAQVDANSNLQLSVCGSVQVPSGQRLLEFDRAIHRGHRAGELNQKAVAYRFYLLPLMLEERGPQESAVFIEQLHRKPLVALRQRAVAHHVREHDRGELALFEPFDSHLRMSFHQFDGLVFIITSCRVGSGGARARTDRP